jgi:hypothetical protein
MDGFETSYSYRTEDEFINGRNLMKSEGRKYSQLPELHDQIMKVGFANWVDYSGDDATKSCGETTMWDMINFACNWFTPEEYEAAISNALKYADAASYIWVYTHQVNWWTKTNLPTPYVTALARARYLAGCDVTAAPGSVEKRTIQVYPNPASDKVTIHTPFLKTTITIKNVLGVIVCPELPVDEDQSIDFSRLSNGVYFLELRSDTKLQRIKIMKVD